MNKKIIIWILALLLLVNAVVAAEAMDRNSLKAEIIDNIIKGINAAETPKELTDFVQYVNANWPEEISKAYIVTDAAAKKRIALTGIAEEEPPKEGPSYIWIILLLLLLFGGGGTGGYLLWRRRRRAPPGGEGPSPEEQPPEETDEEKRRREEEERRRAEEEEKERKKEEERRRAEEEKERKRAEKIKEIEEKTKGFLDNLKKLIKNKETAINALKRWQASLIKELKQEKEYKATEEEESRFVNPIFAEVKLKWGGGSGKTTLRKLLQSKITTEQLLANFQTAGFNEVILNRLRELLTFKDETGKLLRNQIAEGMSFETAAGKIIRKGVTPAKLKSYTIIFIRHQEALKRLILHELDLDIQERNQLRKLAKLETKETNRLNDLIKDMEEAEKAKHPHKNPNLSPGKALQLKEQIILEHIRHVQNVLKGKEELGEDIKQILERIGYLHDELYVKIKKIIDDLIKKAREFEAIENHINKKLKKKMGDKAREKLCAEVEKKLKAWKEGENGLIKKFEEEKRFLEVLEKKEEELHKHLIQRYFDRRQTARKSEEAEKLVEDLPRQGTDVDIWRRTAQTIETWRITGYEGTNVKIEFHGIRQGKKIAKTSTIPLDDFLSRIKEAEERREKDLKMRNELIQFGKDLTSKLAKSLKTKKLIPRKIRYIAFETAKPVHRGHTKAYGESAQGSGYILDLDKAFIYRFYNKERLYSVSYFIGFVKLKYYWDFKPAYNTQYLQEPECDSLKKFCYGELTRDNFKELLIFEMNHAWDYLRKKLKPKERAHKHISSGLTEFYALTDQQAETMINQKIWIKLKPSS